MAPTTQRPDFAATTWERSAGGAARASVRPVIHVGIDGSWRAAGALEWALQESLLRHEPLRAVHIIEQTHHTRYYEPAEIAQTELDLVEDVRQRMRDSGDDLDHRADLVAGSPAVSLTRLASGSRMLVVGRRGTGTFKRLLLGSTSEAVANLGDAPVVVVPAGWPAAPSRSPVIVALDDSGENDPAIEFAVEAAVERNVPLRLVNVWDMPAVYGWDPAIDATQGDDWADAVQGHFEPLVDRWRRKYPELDIDLDVRRAHPVDGVLEAAQEVQAQLVVLGGRHRPRLSVLVLGSVARGVLQHAICPVAVVHHPESQEQTL
ncbi:nucleotide-binding universal stress UspA family protein [Kribbella sp. VKM Ac-2568]|nr:nucleotide-binding universal stress UspA family protein [Kribbella sp. VKM Ac-2568]